MKKIKELKSGNGSLPHPNPVDWASGFSGKGVVSTRTVSLSVVTKLVRGHRPQRGKTVAWGNDWVAMEAAHWSCSKVAAGLVVWPEAQMELLCWGCWAPMVNRNGEPERRSEVSSHWQCFPVPLQGARSVKPNGLPSWRRRQVYRVQLQYHKAGQRRMDLELGDRKLVTASSLLDYLASTYTYTMSF